jgi:adenosylcobinamide kinase / adenosylcobinamide-phosphate guanylyltransferase
MVADKVARRARPQHPLILVLGGARSGKSTYAEARTRSLCARGKQAIYVATAQAHDREMATRIAAHKKQRGKKRWRTLEAPLELSQMLAAQTEPTLVDCLTLWLTNQMLAERPIAAAAKELCRALAKRQAPIVLVANEVGLGIVPDNKMARDFRDHAGRLHQAIGAIATDVVFVAAGLPLALKGKTA